MPYRNLNYRQRAFVDREMAEDDDGIRRKYAEHLCETADLPMSYVPDLMGMGSLDVMYASAIAYRDSRGALKTAKAMMPYSEWMPMPPEPKYADPPPDRPYSEWFPEAPTRKELRSVVHESLSSADVWSVLEPEPSKPEKPPAKLTDWIMGVAATYIAVLSAMSVYAMVNGGDALANVMVWW